MEFKHKVQSFRHGSHCQVLVSAKVDDSVIQDTRQTDWFTDKK